MGVIKNGLAGCGTRLVHGPTTTAACCKVKPGALQINWATPLVVANVSGGAIDPQRYASLRRRLQSASDPIGG